VKTALRTNGGCTQAATLPPPAEGEPSRHEATPAKPTAYYTVSSMQVFRRHLLRNTTDNEVLVDATGINSKACYDEWQARALRSCWALLSSPPIDKKARDSCSCTSGSGQVLPAHTFSTSDVCRRENGVRARGRSRHSRRAQEKTKMASFPGHDVDHWHKGLPRHGFSREACVTVRWC